MSVTAITKARLAVASFSITWKNSMYFMLRTQRPQPQPQPQPLRSSMQQRESPYT
jgi:hypothetical protein